MPNEELENHALDPTYGLYFNINTKFILLDENYEDKGAYVEITKTNPPNKDDDGVIAIQARNGRPKGSKVSVKKKPKVETSGGFVEVYLKVSKVTVIKTVKKNDNETGDHWDYDYQFNFKASTNASLDYKCVLTLRHKQNGKTHQFMLGNFKKENDFEITLTNQDTALFGITKTVIGENIFDVIVSDWDIPEGSRTYGKKRTYEDVITDFTVDLSDLNLVQKGRYAAQRTAGNVKD